MEKLKEKGFIEPLKAYINANKPFLGICVGMQCLFKRSQESDGVEGLGIIDAIVSRLDNKTKSVPHIGWNSCATSDLLLNHEEASRYYFVHSYAVKLETVPSSSQEWISSLTTFGDETFVSSVHRGNVFATQFHPEKSGTAGLKVLDSFLKSTYIEVIPKIFNIIPPPDCLTKRIIACLDVRANDNGDLVVTKGDQYDVREKEGNSVRNLGKPVDLARRYYEEGADEITFLNITSFRDSPLQDEPMLQVLRKTSETVFVPLTIGGGIRDLKQPDGSIISALEVAGEYFRSGADKVSIGSDAVYATELFLKGGRESNAITEISRVYGRQALVISVDPKRVYVVSPDSVSHTCFETAKLGPNGEGYCWYQCTVRGGRECRDVDVKQLITSCMEMGAGEILLNCMDHDGQNQGFDLELINFVKTFATVPVIASSGAGCSVHFSQVFKSSNVEAALAAGIFHRREVPIGDVKEYLKSDGYMIR